MHEKYASQGLVLITVNVDDIHEEPALKEEAVKILRNKKVPGIHLLLDEPAEFYRKKLDFIAPPCVFIFNKQGKWRQLKNDTEEQVKYDIIEKMVQEFLKGP